MRHIDNCAQFGTVPHTRHSLLGAIGGTLDDLVLGLGGTGSANGPLVNRGGMFPEFGVYVLCNSTPNWTYLEWNRYLLPGRGLQHYLAISLLANLVSPMLLNVLPRRPTLPCRPCNAEFVTLVLLPS